MLALPLRGSTPELYHGKYVAGMFGSGEQGVWYDPSDLSTLFQDAAGTIPVTAVGQPVGLMLDKSKNGVGRNGARRVNLLTYSERFNTGWTYASGAPENTVVSIIPNAALSPIETATASKIVEVAATSRNRIYKFVSITSGILYTFSISLKSAGRRYVSIRLSSGANNYGILIDLDTGLTYTGQWDGSATTNNLSNVSVVNEGNGWLRLTGTFLSESTSLGIFVQLAASTDTTLYTGDGVSGIYVWGADLRLASEANTQPLYQRVDADWSSTIPGNHATQATTASRPTLQQDTSGKYYLSFDGVDDYLSTGSINFTATDKMTVLAGVRKLIDGGTSVVAELSSNILADNQCFTFLAPSVSGSYRFFSKGTLIQGAGTGNFAPAPNTSVITGIGNISGDVVSIRRNGALLETNSTDQGDGNYGNYPLYIGRRGGTTNPFSGNLYGLIVRGAQTDDAHLTHAEKYLAYKSGVTL